MTSRDFPAPIKVGLVEDQRQTREGLAALIEGTPGFSIIGAWRSMEEALASLSQHVPDVLLADIQLPGINGIDGVRRIKKELPSVQILMLTVHDESDAVFEAICAGACGYLLKDVPPAKLLEAIREASMGGAPMSPAVARKVVTMFQQVVAPRTDETRLTARELEVLRLLAGGHSYKTAADVLDLSLDTIRYHVRNVYSKLHVNSKSDAVVKALRTGLVK
jgi:DNA-binding NarL/FixJ family response regulator